MSIYMGISLFKVSSDKYDVPKYGDNRGSYSTFGNPDPKNYKIVDVFEKRPYLLIRIKYPDCHNYEGMKILLYKDVTLVQLERQKQIDPHFSQNSNYHSPLARFEPTDIGWKTGLFLIESLLKHGGP